MLKRFWKRLVGKLPTEVEEQLERIQNPYKDMTEAEIIWHKLSAKREIITIDVGKLSYRQAKKVLEWKKANV